tara:strand:- start:747 stop:1499 length:753 start_codon:yes stop_codon:yes gene_type:complete
MHLETNKLSNIPKMPCDVDNFSDLPFLPEPPLPVKSFAMYIVGSPGSGKTNLLMSLLTSNGKKNKPLYYYKFFDHIELISASISTLPKKFLKQLPDEQQHNKFSDELIVDIINDMKNSENENNLIVIDDCIRDVTRSKNLSKIFLNRRHITHDPDKEGNGGLSTILTSQKYTICPLEFRNAQSDFMIFKSSNATEVNRIKEELMHDLNKDEQDELLDMAWSKPYGFLYIKINKNKDCGKYFINFDKVVFE